MDATGETIRYTDNYYEEVKMRKLKCNQGVFTWQHHTIDWAALAHSMN